MLSQNTASGDVEGFGIAILEANSLGIPSIGAKNCGIEDAILDYKSGILIQNNNPSEFEKSIKNILENYNLYGYESIIWASKFSWNNIIKEYIKILEL
ncbi:MAG: glycosyltransferase, partial [Polaribacter sp.]|nr:glycosyltransferase [Polaribacter sp.]